MTPFGTPYAQTVSRSPLQAPALEQQQPVQQQPGQQPIQQQPVQQQLGQQPIQQQPVQQQPGQQPIQQPLQQQPVQQPLQEQAAQQSVQQPMQQQPVQQPMSWQQGQASASQQQPVQGSVQQPVQQPLQAGYQAASPAQFAPGAEQGQATMQPTQAGGWHGGSSAAGVATPAVSSQYQAQSAQPAQLQASAPVGQQGVGQPLAQSPAQPQVGQIRPTGQQLQRPGEGPQGTFVPQVDVWDSPEEFTVMADLPGCGPEDVELQATDNSLHIIATRKPEEFEEESRVYQRERLDRAERRIELPSNVDVDNAEATCENGVCHITLPKREDEQQKRIGIH